MNIIMKRCPAFAMTVLLTGLASCSDDLGRTDGPEVCTITASLGGTGRQTRTAIDDSRFIGGETGILWTSRDTIGVFGDNDVNVPFTNALSAPQGRVQFNGVMTGTPKYAYFPYCQTAGTDVTALKGHLDAEQPYDRTTRYISGDYKCGAPRANVPDEFDFEHLFCLIRFTVDAGGTGLGGESLETITVTAPSGRVISGDFTFNAIDGTYTMAGGTGSEKAGVRMAEAVPLTPGVPVTAYASMAPGIKTNDRLTISIGTADHIATFTATVNCDFEANTVYTFDLKLDNFCDESHNWSLKSLPTFRSFEFTVAANTGKILDKRVQSAKGGETVTETSVTTEPLTINGHEITGMIPYLYDFNLVPTFTVSDGVKVKVNDVEQTSGETVQDFSKPVTYTLESADGAKSEYTVNVTNTGLPVVVVNQSTTLTGGSWRNWFGGVNVRTKDSDWVADDAVSVYGADGSSIVSAAAAGVRLRGNSTQNFPKKPFAIKFDKKQAPVPGLAPHKRWVLLANWLDCSMMRNNTAFAIAHATESAWAGGTIGKGLAWNPHGMSVELVLDGRHVGNYYLCEQIKINKNRLNIKDAYEDVASPTFANCGYLIECDDNYDENCRFLTSRRYLPFMLKDDVSDEILTQLKAKVNSIESNIVNGNYSAAYADLDINSLIDQWIVFELTMNGEYKHPKSVYMYMDGGGSKLCAGPVWDFDYQTFPNADRVSALNAMWGGASAPSMEKWLYSDSAPATSAQERNESDKPYMWYPLLFKDETFRETVRARWSVIYPQLLAVENEIAAYADKYARSWEVNNAMWPLAFRRSNVTGWSPAFAGDEDLKDYGSVVDNLRSMYAARLAWMNTQITQGNFVTNAK